MEHLRCFEVELITFKSHWQVPKVVSGYDIASVLSNIISQPEISGHLFGLWHNS